jgi:hypothetical protein
VQIPLADLRHFVPDQTGRLTAPPWPLADPSKDFVRAVGPVRRRQRGGAPEWIGEDLYCDARRAVIFPPGRSLQHQASLAIHLSPQYRRFLATGRFKWPTAVARVDVGFLVRFRNPNGRVTSRTLPVPRDAALAAATVTMRIPPDNRLRMLLDAGGAFADRVRVVTTSLKNPPSDVNKWWVQAGCPLVLVEAPFARSFLKALDPPVDADAVMAKTRDATAFHHFSYLEYGHHRIPVWTLFCNPDLSAVKLRLLRIHLWRLHNEREVLKLVLAACIQGRLDPSQAALRDYLARQSASLRQPTREGLPQASLLSQAYALDSLVNANDIGLLSELLRDVSPGLEASVALLAKAASVAPGQVTIIAANGDVQVARNIENNDARQDIHPSGPVGAIISGNASVSGGNFQGSGVQNISVLDGVDLQRLASQLEQLAAALTQRASTPDQVAAAEQVKKAEGAAREGDMKAVWAHLKKVGQWALDIATQIGVGLAVAVIAAAI